MNKISSFFLLAAVLSLVTCKKSEESKQQPVTPVVPVLGASARDLLSGERFTSVSIEVSYMPGFALQEQTVNELRDFLGTLLNKPAGITITQKVIQSGGKAVYTLQDIRTIEGLTRTAASSGSVLGVHLLITDGAYTSPNVLGIAYEGTSAALFGKTIHDNSGGITQVSRSFLESVVTRHEFGHLFGLVNIGTALQSAHEDLQHPGHCSNRNCLMFYAAETTDILSSLTGTLPDFDSACRADMKANGGK